MDKPRKATFNAKRETSTLYFKDFDDSREFYLRGAVTWPEGDADGFALLGGQNVKGNRVHIFEQIEFATADDIIRDGQIRYHGLSSWLNRCWSKYFGRLYFWSQPQDLHDRFRLQVYRSSSIQPKPSFIEAPLTSEEDSRSLVVDYIRTGRVAIEAGSELAKELEVSRHDDKVQLPAVRALGRLLAGLQRYPFVNHHVEEDFY
jgi:hypothetical protein